MKTWHYRRIKIPFKVVKQPYQAPAGNWVFFFISVRHDATKTVFRETRFPLATLGLDGVE